MVCHRYEMIFSQLRYTEDSYSRFLPLELHKDVDTTFVNGIKKRDLK